MKKEIKGFIAGALSVSLLSAGVSYAAGWLENISVVKNSTTISANYQPVNADNFIYNDTTYVPLRALTESLGCVVMWNEETRDISVNNAPLDNAKLAARALSNLDSIESSNRVLSSTNDLLSTAFGASIDGVLGNDRLFVLSEDMQKAKDGDLKLRNYFKNIVPLKYFVENNRLINIDPNTINNIFDSMDKQLSEMDDSLQALTVFNSYDLRTKQSVYATDSYANRVYNNSISVQNRYFDIDSMISDVRYALYDYIKNQ